MSVAAGLAWRYVTHALMLGLALWNEGRPAPTLPDTLLDLIPRSAFLARHNYTLWLLAYLPAGLWLWARDRRLFVRFLWVGGWVSLLRGLTICAFTSSVSFSRTRQRMRWRCSTRSTRSTARR